MNQKCGINTLGTALDYNLILEIHSLIICLYMYAYRCILYISVYKYLENNPDPTDTAAAKGPENTKIFL